MANTPTKVQKRFDKLTREKAALLEEVAELQAALRLCEEIIDKYKTAWIKGRGGR
jgi:hypothetical protein